MKARRSDGADLQVVSSGEGEALVLIHGAGGNAAIWTRQVKAFAPTRRVVAFDGPGFRRSPTGAAKNLPQLLASAPATALDALGIARADVVRQSLGYVA